jgi:hypothetical protein
MITILDYFRQKKWAFVLKTNEHNDNFLYKLAVPIYF